MTFDTQWHLVLEIVQTLIGLIALVIDLMV